MDTDAIEKRGLAPIQPELDRIAALQSTQDLPPSSPTSTAWARASFSITVQCRISKTPPRDCLRRSEWTWPSEKDYYLRTDDESVETRKQYVAHLANVLKLLGDSPDAAQSEAQKIMDLETELAKASRARSSGATPRRYTT